MVGSFDALVVRKSDAGPAAGIERLSFDDLPDGDVTVRVRYSSVNYKDGLVLAGTPAARRFPLVPGIDLAGTVAESADPRFVVGQKVVAIGRDLGVSHHGGYAEFARLPGQWLERLPDGLTLREAMALGTAGFTAALAVQRLEQHGVTPRGGRVLVTGASGGVGSLAVSMLAGRGYQVSASTGKTAEHAFLRDLGVDEILSRDEVSTQSDTPLQPERWAGAIDPVGGDTLAYLLRSTCYGGTVAACGLAGGRALDTTVMPFILRGVNLVGIDSVRCPADTRAALWRRLGTDLKPRFLTEGIAQEIDLGSVAAVASAVVAGTVKGRTIVRL